MALRKFTNKETLIQAIIKLMTEEKAKLSDPNESLLSFATKLGTAIDNYGLKLITDPLDTQKFVTESELSIIINRIVDSLNLKEDKINKGIADGYAPLDSFIKILSSYLYVVNDTTTGGIDAVASAETVKDLQIQINNVVEDKNFIFNQGLPLATWAITHNLGKFPSVTVIDSAGTEYEGEIQHIDNNSLVLWFSAAFSGQAIMN